MMLSARTEQWIQQTLDACWLDWANASLGKGRYPHNPEAAWGASLREAYARGYQDAKDGWAEPDLPDLREPTDRLADTV